MKETTQDCCITSNSLVFYDIDGRLQRLQPIAAFSAFDAICLAAMG